MMNNPDNLTLLETLRKKQVYHEARAGKLRDAIKALEAHPELEELYLLVKNARQP